MRPTGISRAVRYGKAAFDTSAVVVAARMSRARGPQRPKQQEPPVTSSSETDPSVGRCRWMNPRSWVPNAVPVTMRNRVGSEPRDREVALDAAALVQHGCVDDRAHRLVDVVAAQPLEETEGARAHHLELRERRLVEEPRPLASRDVLGLDRRRPEPPANPARAPALVPRRRVRLEPVRPFPARLLAERGPELAEPRIRRRQAEPAPLLALLVRVAEVVVGAVDLVGRARGSAAGTGTGRRTGGGPCARRRAPGSPSTIQSAMIRPMPPAPAMPWAQKPHATKSPGPRAPRRG